MKRSTEGFIIAIVAVFTAYVAEMLLRHTDVSYDTRLWIEYVLTITVVLVGIAATFAVEWWKENRKPPFRELTPDEIMWPIRLREGLIPVRELTADEAAQIIQTRRS